MGWLAHERLGYNYRLSEINAALGVAQMAGSTKSSPTAAASPRPTWSG
jgi:dTDP-4-amino-4,6-dideoxygalactose transaminase